MKAHRARQAPSSIGVERLLDSEVLSGWTRGLPAVELTLGARSGLTLLSGPVCGEPKTEGPRSGLSTLGRHARGVPAFVERHPTLTVMDDSFCWS
jgi:hypothetical protein